MKKIALIMMFILTSVLSRAGGPGNPCNCTTTVTNLVEWVDIGPDCGGTGDAYVIISYQLVQCGPESGIMFSSAQFVEQGSCNPPIFQRSTIQDFYKKAQQYVLDLYPTASGGVMDWVYPSGCLSLATVNWPDYTCYTFYGEGPDSGKIASVTHMGDFGNNTLNLLPCDGANCCSFKYTYDVNTRHYTFLEKSPDIVCTSDFRTTSISFTCLDIKRNPQTYTG